MSKKIYIVFESFDGITTVDSVWTDEKLAEKRLDDIRNQYIKAGVKSGIECIMDLYRIEEATLNEPYKTVKEVVDWDH